MKHRLLCFRNLFHRQHLAVPLLLHLPHAPESPRAHLVEELVVVSAVLLELGGLRFKGSGNVGIVVADDHCLVAIFLD